MSAREDLATLIRAGSLPTGTTVYAFPSDLIKLPAVVIMLGDPWMMPSSTSPAGYRVNLEVIVQVQRTNPRAYIPKLEELIDAVVASFRESSWRFVEAGIAEEIKTGDVEAIGSKIVTTNALQGGLS